MFLNGNMNQLSTHHQTTADVPLWTETFDVFACNDCNLGIKA